jgi:hypothetical protein
MVVGRDPTCDLVLNDAKCSRRHAIVEMGPSGLVVRDNGSANGVFVNGRKVERSPLIPGDIMRVGETVLKVLTESTGTVVMGADEMEEYRETEDLTRPQDLALVPDETTSEMPGSAPAAAEPPPPTPPAAAPPPSRRPPPPASKSSPPRQRPPHVAAPVARVGLPRPMTITVLAVLWLLASGVYGALGLGYAIFGARGSALAVGAAGLSMAGISLVVGFGLWARAPWARLLQLVLAAVGVFSCVFTLPSLAIIAYLLRPEIQLHFVGPRILSAEESERATSATPEMAFTMGIVGTLVLGILLAAIAGYVARTWLRRPEVPPGKGEPPATLSSPLPAPGATPR